MATDSSLSSWEMLKFDTPMLLTLPEACRASISYNIQWFFFSWKCSQSASFTFMTLGNLGGSKLYIPYTPSGSSVPHIYRRIDKTSTGQAPQIQSLPLPPKMLPALVSLPFFITLAHHLIALQCTHAQNQPQFCTIFICMFTYIYIILQCSVLWMLCIYLSSLHFCVAPSGAQRKHCVLVHRCVDNNELLSLKS